MFRRKKQRGERDMLRQALDYDFPEIQKHLIEQGEKDAVFPHSPHSFCQGD